VNFRFVIRQVGLLLLVLSIVMVLVAGLAAFDWKYGSGGTSERSAMLALLFTAAISALAGGGSILAIRPESTLLGRREAMLLVAVTWTLGAVIAGLPFLFWAHLQKGTQDPTFLTQPFLNPVNCLFEAMSGLTTTGATILTDIESLPRGILLWRSLTHWLGGLGIVVLFVAVLPSLGAGGKRLVGFEISGPRKQSIQPNIRDTARMIGYIYCGLTFLCILAYGLLTPMNWFDAVNHAGSTVSTGGFSTRNASFAHWNSAAVETICIIVMVLAGISFALFYAMIKGRHRMVSRDPELRVYLTTQLLVALLIALTLIGKPIMLVTGAGSESATAAEALRHAAFVTVSLHTGSGFTTADYGSWPAVTHWMLLGLMVIGGCAGSTAGGLKIVRVWIAARVLLGELEKAYRPNVVRALRIGGGSIDQETKLASVTFILGFTALLFVGCLLTAIFEARQPDADMQTLVSASIATLSNVGPGFGGIGPSRNYGWFTDGSKLVYTAFMAIGRVEFFAFLVLMTPRFWRGM